MRYVFLIISLAFTFCGNAYALGSISNPLGIDITKKTKQKSLKKSKVIPPLPLPITKKESKGEAEIQKAESEEALGDEDAEFTPFIDKGSSSLPIAPEVARALSETDIPDSIFEGSLERLDKHLTRKTVEEEEEEIEKDIEALFSNIDAIVEDKENQEDTPEPIHLAQKSEAIPAEDTNTASPPLLTDTEKVDTQTQENKVIVKKQENSPEPKAITQIAKKPQDVPPIPAPNATSSKPAQAEVKPTPTKAKKILTKSKKTKLNPKLMRFVRDESVFILFKDDDVILGKLSNKASLDQMPFPSYYQKYTKALRTPESLIKSQQIEKFIKARSYVAHIPLSNRNLIANIKSEINSSNLSNLRILENYYDTLDISDELGNSMVHMASMKNNLPATKWLIMKGAKLGMLNNNNLSAREIAYIKGNRDIYFMLKKAGAK